MPTTPRDSSRTAAGHGRFTHALVVVALVALWIVALPPGDRAAAQGGVPGTLDPTFDVDGVAVNELVSRLSEVTDAERLPDGRVLVLAGGSVWRFFADGTLDTSFDLDGVLTPNVGGNFVAAELAVRPGGGFVISSGNGVSNPSCTGGQVVKYAADGTVDPGFGSSGIACIDFPDFNGGLISDLAVQADDRVLALGSHQAQSSASRLALVRLSATGTTEETIVQAGVSSFESGEEMVIQADGNIVVSGSTNTFPNFSVIGIVLSRYLADTLELDDTFGSGGLAEQSAFLGTSRRGIQLALRPDGQGMSVVIVGTQPSGSDDVAAVEQLIFDDTGSLSDSPLELELTGHGFAVLDDLTPTPTGYVAIGHFEDFDPPSPTRDGMFAVAFGQEWIDPDTMEPLVLLPQNANLPLLGGPGLLFPDGTVWVTSVIEGPAGEQFLFNRLIEDTTTDPRSVALDPSLGTAFGQAGFLTRNAFTRDRAEGVVVQADGKAVVGGFTSAAAAGPGATLGDQGFVLRHNEDGTLDPTFGGSQRAGVAFLDFDVRDVALAPAGGVVAAGSRFFPSNGSSHQDGAVQRLLATGAPDPDWNDGFPTFFNPGDILPGAFFRDVAVQDDGKVVVVGDHQICEGSAGCEFWITVVRFLEDGSVDAAFGTDGVTAIGPASEGETLGHGLAIGPDGSILVTGSLASQLVLARVDPDGTLDATFGTDGVATPPLSGVGGLGRGVALRADGRIVVAGDLIQTDCSSVVACFTRRSAIAFGFVADGNPDSSFGIAGLAPITAAPSEGHGVAVDAAGNIVVAGTVIAGGTGPDLLLARLSGAGAFDPDFGTNGLTVTDVEQSEAGSGLALAPDGKILVAGASNNSRGDRVVSARYEAGAALQCAPSPLDLGSVVLGTGSSNGAVTCTNTGPSRLTITDITTSGANAGDFDATTGGCLRTLAPAQSCQSPVSFTPLGVGARAAVLSVTFTGRAGTGPIAVALQGTGVAPDTTLTFEPPALTFPEALGLTTSPAQDVTVTNTGTVPVTVNGVSVEGDPAGDFTIAASTCTGATLPPGGRCVVSVTFTARAPGPRTATLRFDHTGSGTPAGLPLSGSGAIPIVVVNPGVGPAGFVTSGLGANFPPGQVVTLQWVVPEDSPSGKFAEPPVTATTGDGGTLTTSLLLLPKARLGTRTLRATAGAFIAESSFLVVPGTLQGPDFVIRS